MLQRRSLTMHSLGKLPGALLLLFATRVLAHPFLPMREVPSAMGGPTEPQVASIVDNPGALGLLRGVHLYLDAAANLGISNITLDSAKESTGRNLAPFGFAGVTANFRDRITFGFASYLPYNSLDRFSGAVSAQASRFDFTAVQQTFAVGARVTNAFAFGASFSVLESWVDQRFDRDIAPSGGSALVAQSNSICGGAACGYGNALAKQSIRAAGFGFGLSFGIGLLARPIDKLWLALSFQSRTFNRGTSDDLALGSWHGATIKPAPGQGALACNSDGNCQGRSLVTLPLPNILRFGARVKLPHALEGEFVFRWTNWGPHPHEEVALQGGNLGKLGTPMTGGVPDRFLFDSGLQDNFLASLSLTIPIGTKVRLMPYIAYESPAVARTRVTSGTLDANKVDASLILRAHVTKRFTIGANLGVTTYAMGHIESAWSSQNETACVDANYSLSACGARVDGRGWPSATGNYVYVVPHIGLSMGASF